MKRYEKKCKYVITCAEKQGNNRLALKYKERLVRLKKLALP